MQTIKIRNIKHVGVLCEILAQADYVVTIRALYNNNRYYPEIDYYEIKCNIEEPEE